MTHRPVLVLPGYGGPPTDPPPHVRNMLQAAQWVFDEVSAAAGGLEPPGPLPSASRSPAAGRHGPQLPAQLVWFGISVAAVEILRMTGIEPFALLGHSYGELTALTCAGAFSVPDGVRILHELDRCVDRFGPLDSGMLSVAADPDTVGCFVAAIDDPRLTIACYNAPERTVVCGPNTSLHQIVAMARERDVICVPLPAPYAFHGPLVAAAVERARHTLADVGQRPLRAAVFSATANRYYRDGDELVRRLVEGLHLPVRFFAAVARLHTEGADGFLECAPKGMLARLIPQCLPGVMSAASFDFLTAYQSQLSA